MQPSWLHSTLMTPKYCRVFVGKGKGKIKILTNDKEIYQISSQSNCFSFSEDKTKSRKQQQKQERAAIKASQRRKHHLWGCRCRPDIRPPAKKSQHNENFISEDPVSYWKLLEATIILSGCPIVLFKPWS